jgi:hypothetical protein
MYNLDNFYQNYFSYSQSRSYDQLHGENVSVSTLVTDCRAGNYVNTSGPWGDGINNLTYAPCGLVAHSFFSDHISLIAPKNVAMSENNIAWSSDKDFLFRNPEFWSTFREDVLEHKFLYQSYANTGYEAGFYENNYVDEHFMVWMRAAAFNRFKKPYGIIEDGITVASGTPVILKFNVSNIFEVDQFNGSKALSIQSFEPLGGTGSQPVWAWLQVVLGCISTFTAIVLLVQECICPHNIKKRALGVSINYNQENLLSETLTN